jgi:hypothetical protein
MRRSLAFLEGPAPLAAAGGVWRYLDDGSIPPADWKNGEFDDDAWPAGAAQLGFGEGDEATVLNPDPARQPDTGVDSDNDRLTDEHEAQIGTDPPNPDTDGDGVSDGDEVYAFGTDPLTPDSPREEER